MTTTKERRMPNDRAHNCRGRLGRGRGRSGRGGGGSSNNNDGGRRGERGGGWEREEEGDGGSEMGSSTTATMVVSTAVGAMSPGAIATGDAAPPTLWGWVPRTSVGGLSRAAATGGGAQDTLATVPPVPTASCQGCWATRLITTTGGRPTQATGRQTY